MDEPTLMSVLASWSWRPAVVLVVATLGSAYVCGWARLRIAGHRRLARWWRLLLYLAGLGALVAALLSPIDRLASLLLTAHMIQHLLLTMVAAPLLLLGNPLPAGLWGLPRRARRAAGRLLIRNAAFRRVLWAVTLMPVAWLLHVGTVWTWHLPVAYEAALRNHFIHDLEHLTFFGTALLFWWPIVEPAPRLHARVPPGFGILYLIAATGQNTLLGALIALPERVLPLLRDAAPPVRPEAPRRPGLSGRHHVDEWAYVSAPDPAGGRQSVGSRATGTPAAGTQPTTLSSALGRGVVSG
jgi:cytochrome c oxidase assembly factor CtaG